MKTTAKVGGILELEILRADGTIENYGKIHNVVGYAAFPAGRVPYVGPASITSGSPTFGTQTSVGTVDLDGTYSQAGATVTRVTGTSSLSDLQNGDIIQFGSGEWAYKTASVSASSCTVSKTQSVVATTAKRLKTYTNGFGTFSSSGAIQTSTGPSYGLATTYLNGVITNTMTAPRALPIVVAPYTLRCISAGLYMASHATQYSTYYDLPVPINLLIGDTVIIKSWVYTITCTNYLPIPFAVSVINGLSGSGKYQTLLKPQDQLNANNTDPRIWLISDANKIVIPNRLAPDGAYILPAALTPIETLAAVFTATPPAIANNMTEGASFIAATNTGGTIKQIAWGSLNHLHGIIEFDTPVVIAPDKSITISTSSMMEIELP